MIQVFITAIVFNSIDGILVLHHSDHCLPASLFGFLYRFIKAVAPYLWYFPLSHLTMYSSLFTSVFPSVNSGFRWTIILPSGNCSTFRTHSSFNISFTFSFRTLMLCIAFIFVRIKNEAALLPGLQSSLSR